MRRAAVDPVSVIGTWYTYQDDGGSTITSAYHDPNGYGPFGNQDGQFCFSGTVVGHHDADYSTNWGVGLGLDVCAMPEDLTRVPEPLRSQVRPEQQFQAADCPTLLSGVDSITFTITGSWPELRVSFEESRAQEVAPFYTIFSAGTYTVMATDTIVPADWDVSTAGTVGTSNVTAIQFQIPSVTDDAAYDFCIGNVTIN